jgi:hypothetical protein
MRGAIPPLPQYAFIAWFSSKAQKIEELFQLVTTHFSTQVIGCHFTELFNIILSLFSTPLRPSRLWGPLSSYPLGTGGFSPRLKRPRCEADHSPSPNTEIKNAWSHTSTPLSSLSTDLSLVVGVLQGVILATTVTR